MCRRNQGFRVCCYKFKAQPIIYYVIILLYAVSYVLLIAGLCVDKISKVTYDNVVSYTFYCGWQELYNSDSSSTSDTYKYYCDQGSDDFCTEEKVGRAWLALGIVAALLGLIGWAFIVRHMFERSHIHGACGVLLFSILCIAAVGEWGNQDKCKSSCEQFSSCKLTFGDSWYLVLFAGILGVITSICTSQL